MPWITGEYLNRKWQIGAKQSRFAEAGRFYMPLEKFPGALCDPCGYVLFDMEDELREMSSVATSEARSENPAFECRETGNIQNSRICEG